MARVFRTGGMIAMGIICLLYLPIFRISSGVCCMVAVLVNFCVACSGAPLLVDLYWVAFLVGALRPHGTGDSWRNMIYYNQSSICSLDSRKICCCPRWGFVMIGLYLGRVRRSGKLRPPLFDLGLLLLPQTSYSRRMGLIAAFKR